MGDFLWPSSTSYQNPRHQTGRPVSVRCSDSSRVVVLEYCNVIWNRVSLSSAVPAITSRSTEELNGAQAQQEPRADSSRTRRRPRRRELLCPLHPEQKLFSVSPKHHLYITDVGQLVLRGLSKRKADELLAAYKRVLPLSDEWLECFWCEDCGSSSWWHVTRLEKQVYTLSPVARDLWEQASGVIRPEGNPTISEFSRRQARACGVHGLRTYRFL